MKLCLTRPGSPRNIYKLPYPQLAPRKRELLVQRLCVTNASTQNFESARSALARCFQRARQLQEQREKEASRPEPMETPAMPSARS
jgi:hypothetical protein